MSKDAAQQRESIADAALRMALAELVRSIATHAQKRRRCGFANGAR